MGSLYEAKKAKNAKLKLTEVIGRSRAISCRLIHELRRTTLAEIETTSIADTDFKIVKLKRRGK